MTAAHYDTDGITSLDDQRHLVDEWIHAKAVAKHTEKRAQQLERDIRELLGTASVGTIDGTPVVCQQPIARLQFQKLKAEHPDVVDNYMVCQRKLQLLRPQRPHNRDERKGGRS